MGSFHDSWKAALIWEKKKTTTTARAALLSHDVTAWIWGGRSLGVHHSLPQQNSHHSLLHRAVKHRAPHEPWTRHTHVVQSWAVRQVMRLVWRRHPSGKGTVMGNGWRCCHFPSLVLLQWPPKGFGKLQGKRYKANSRLENEVKDKRKAYKNKKTQERKWAARGMMRLSFPGFWQKVRSLFEDIANPKEVFGHLENIFSQQQPPISLISHNPEALNSFPKHHSLPSSASVITAGVL